MQVDENISAVITGGASGLGEATARELSKRGAKCSLFDLNVEKGEAVASEINGTFCEVNVTEEESVVKGFEKARKENIDISSWYPSLYKMYSNQKSSFFKNSNIIDRQIVNLWVLPEYSVKKIKNNIKKINKILN